MKSHKAREGDFVETSEGLIFDVKGLVHPPDRIVAFLRYLEDPSGDRRKGGKTYRKVYSLSKRDETIRSRYPQYLFYDPVFGEYLQEVPHRFVSELYHPVDKVSELIKKPHLDRVETQALRFVRSLYDSSGVSFDKLGLSGSILVDLYTESSDIDVVVYGRSNCLSVYDALKQLMKVKGGPVSQYTRQDLQRLYQFRSEDTRMPLRDFIRMERRKFSQGEFEGRDFFMRFLLDWDEVGEQYGDRTHIPSGYTRIGAIVEDDSDSIFTPCIYRVSQVQVLGGTDIPSIAEITSFRGRFCEQAKKGERVVAQGKTEKVVEKDGAEFFRLTVGAKPSDFIISKPA